MIRVIIILILERIISNIINVMIINEIFSKNNLMIYYLFLTYR